MDEGAKREAATASTKEVPDGAALAMAESGTYALEERIAYLERILDDLSAIVARQAEQLALIQHRTGMLMAREAERELASGAEVPLADQRPPHW